MGGKIHQVPQAAVTNSTSLIEAAERLLAACAEAPGINGLGFRHGEAVSEAANRLARAEDSVAAAEAALADAKSTRDAAWSALWDRLTLAANFVHGLPHIDEQTKAAADMVAPPAKERAVRPPSSLEAMPMPGGEVKLSWARNRNPAKTTYLVQSRRGGESWTTVSTTENTSVTLVGQAAMESRMFRVIAQWGNQLSLPSGVASVVLPSGSSQRAA